MERLNNNLNNEQDDLILSSINYDNEFNIGADITRNKNFNESNIELKED